VKDRTIFPATGTQIRHHALVAALHPAVRAPLRAVVTRRLSVLPLNRKDTDELEAMFAQPEVWEYEYGRGLTRDETEAFVERQLRLWDQCGFGGCAVRDCVETGLVGVVGLGVPTIPHDLLPAVTVGWRFSPTVWGRGYATEAGTALLDQAFTTMGLERLGCVTNVENRRSVAVAERLGMTVLEETAVLRDDGRASVTALLLQVGRDSWCPRRISGGSP
jgi:RimJ/RimL family protein N-acetyltransferase